MAHEPSDTTPSECDDKSAPEDRHQTRWRKVYGSLGFQKGYNFPLFVIFAGTMLGFSLARIEYLDIRQYALGASPGEWYWYHIGSYRIGIILHLASVIPAGILMVWQFVPLIRKKWILFHRINGYTVSVLLLLGVISALMITRRSFGGLPSTQAGLGLLAIMVTTSLAMALYNIKRLQLDQHRAWMLRMVFYCGVIITLRIIMLIAAQTFALTGDYYITMTCDELVTLTAPSELSEMYPECSIENGPSASLVVPVRADFGGSKANVGASLQQGFAIGIWLAIFLHVVGVELYLNLTRNESTRLRSISYERQLNAGFKHPGSAGLTVDRLGDA